MIPTPEQLRAWQEAEEKATPGPWSQEVWVNNDEGGWAARGPWHKHNDLDEDHPYYDDDIPGDPRHEKAEKDATFIAIARTAVPALIAAVGQLQRIIAENALEHDADCICEMCEVARKAGAKP